MKKTRNIFIASVISAMLFGCATPNKKNSEPSGSYTGTGYGKGGIISVNVELENGMLKDIKVTEQHESGIISTAMDILKTDMLERNKVNVDNVTGATLTCAGYKSAVREALKSAGIEASDLKEKEITPQKIENIEKDYDVVVIGAGGAGLVAAITAAENGAKVAIVEKLKIAAGNTLLSGAEYAAPGNWLQVKEQIEDSAKKLEEDMLKAGDNEGNPTLVKILTENATSGAEWLRDTIHVEWTDELMRFGGHSVTRSLVPLGATGVEIMTKLLKKANDLGIDIIYDTTAKKIITDKQNVVTGLEAENTSGNGITYKFNVAKGVILATGGFGSNIEMRKKYNPEMDEKYNSTDSVADTGDGIIMAEEVGAQLLDMEFIQTYPLCDVLSGGLLYVDDARLYGYSILINKEGKRFVNELERRDVMSKAILAQTGNVCYEIMDQKAFEEAKIQKNHGGEVAYLEANKEMRKADTLEEAAKFFDIDVANLKETIEQYNHYVDAQVDQDFERKAMNMKIENAPFYIVVATPAVHHTMGGVSINENAQVLKADGTVIPNLYAAGEVTGDIHGTNRLGSCALSDLTVFGRIAGKNISK